RIELFDIDRRESLTDGEMNGFARLGVQFVQMRQTEPTSIELTERGMPQRKTGNAQVVDAGAAAIQVPGALEVHKKAVHGTDRHRGQLGDRRGRQSLFRFRK